MKRKSNNLILIFVILILLPSVFIIPIINIILKNIGIEDLIANNPIFAFISSITASISVIIGILVVYRQIEKEKKIYSNTFLISLNDYFATDENIKRCFHKLMKLENKKYSFKAYEKEFKTDEDKYDLLEYLNFMESLQYFIFERVIKISEINELFGKRFFIAINNPYIQDIKLKKYDYSWVNLYRLAKSLIDYRREKGYQVPYEQYSLENMPNYEKYSKGYYNHKSLIANYFKVFSAASTVFLIVFFIVLYFVFNIEIEQVSKTISITGVVIGAFALLFQKIEESNIDRARFLFDLNKKFLSRKVFQEIYIAATKNFYYNLPFNEKNNFIKNIDKISMAQYLAFFEVMNTLLEKKVSNIQDLSFFFSNKFFSIVNNKFIQKDFIINNKENLNNIYRLFFKFSHVEKTYTTYEKYSLNKVDKEYYSFINNIN